MSGIHIITASAGSGKTYRLTELLGEKIASKEVRPEAVMATTFTRKAAAELQERVRQKLISQGLVSEAHRLSAARMGTINAICGRLVNDFTFEKGLFPDAGVLDENAAARELGRSISKVVTAQQSERLAELETLLGGFSWTGVVERLITLARYNGLDRVGLEESRIQSQKGLLSLLGKKLPKNRNLDHELLQALESFIQSVDTDHDTTKTTKKALQMARSVRIKLRQGRRLSWDTWRQMSNFATGKKSIHLTEDLVSIASEHHRHPALHQDMAQAVDLVFEIAMDTLDSYQEHKRLLGVLDFADQETMALELLEQPEVKERLKEGLDLLLVDEFQDTSPIQLAILLRLAELSRKTVWVGDQKQSIYGFRGTDPALMDVCLNELLKPGSANTLETLKKSWRSRPCLVSLTSDVFCPAFNHHGIPEERVRLSPALEDNSDLGPAVEWWTLSAKNQQEDAMALAQGIRDLLNDSQARVRDRQSNFSRQVRPGDIAVLCRTNNICSQVAHALQSINIRTALPGSGLLDTSEVKAVMAGLRLWVDYKDSLAAAELARMFHYSSTPDVWLQTLLENPGEKAFAGISEVSAITELSKQYPTAGVQQSLTLVCQALNIRQWCLSWGESKQRLANLDSLQARAHSYIDACSQEGIGCTPAGFIAHMQELYYAGEDTRNPAGGENAVTVATWHSAKGLEWPVTILSQLGKTFDPNPLGVQVMHDWKNFTTQDPLADRKLRFWFSPYHFKTKNSEFHERLNRHKSMAETERQHYRQELRLLYVGWTRARDRLILAGREPEFQKGILGLLLDEKDNWLLSVPEEEKATWAGRTFDIKTRVLAPAEPEDRTIAPGEDYLELQPVDYPSARISPSEMSGQGRVGSLKMIGDRLSLSGKPDLNLLGEALHTFYAADRPAFDHNHRLNLAREILDRWQCSTWLQPEQLIQSADSLYAWIEKNYPQAEWKRELPVMQRLENESVVFGFIDLLIETPDEMIIIDHKAYPGGHKELLQKSSDFTGQLKAYKNCLQEVGPLPVISYLHYPVGGCVVGVDL
ncbi:UvrD-helicase domain-containing protein [Desulfonatronospira sp.]|uniref:UvrD-helicase domain-containing protein n=1 Tax=Desulfonatronospira sp. TaxID=1962951 RepID=UPI0025C721F0|nr:UvrD-helicase domain-containing protein [Desulfonatronospira sp.]